MSKKLDITEYVGKQYNRWTIISVKRKASGSQEHWFAMCECECGMVAETRLWDVRNNKSKSCGCIVSEKNINRNTSHGKAGSRLYVSYQNFKKKHETPDNWDTFEKFEVWSLKNGYSDEKRLTRIDRSKPLSYKNCKWSEKVNPNEPDMIRIHQIWSGMLERTTSQSCFTYKNYGGRGIIICDEWRYDFIAFYRWALSNGYKSGLTIERKDGDGMYTKDNCVWATIHEQARNKRNNVWLEYNGKVLCLEDWATLRGIDPMTIKKRLTRGWTISDAIEKPTKRNAAL